MRVPNDITAVIAAKDEEATIGDVVRSCLPFAREVLAVVDCRTRDRTAESAIAAGARVIFDHGRGKGDALRAATPEIATEVVVFVDADGSHDVADLPRLVQPIILGVADHVSASRLMGGSSELHGGFDEFFRLTGSSLITACINWKFGVRLSDSQNGFRAIRTEVLRALELRSDGTTIEQEMIFRSLALGYRMSEIPSHEYKRRFGKSHIRVGRAVLPYTLSLIRHLATRRRLVVSSASIEIESTRVSDGAHAHN
jgi:glycosyltransferase involved in cell wall biosynthesis